ncbi:hypothetical protein ACFQX6_48285 [Streptosporangium lutulentum]
MTTESDHYLYHGTCTAMETLKKTNAWKPSVADATAAARTTWSCSARSTGW